MDEEEQKQLSTRVGYKYAGHEDDKKVEIEEEKIDLKDVIKVFVNQKYNSRLS